MPDLGLFLVGLLVTFVVVVACILVGRAEAQSALDRANERRAGSGGSTGESR